MPLPRVHPTTGCRPDQLFGEWSIDPATHQRLVDLCLEVPLEKIVACGGRVDEPKDPVKLYETNGRVAIVNLNGPLTKQPTSFMSMIGGSSTVQAREALRAAVADPAIDRILLSVESPGGTVGGTKDLFDAIRKTDGIKPVYAHINDVGGSAAYWLACGARRITANANAMVGSIGAYTVLKDTSGKWEKDGIKLHVVSSGKYKGGGAEGTPITDTVIKEVQTRIDDIAALFVGDVAAARKMKREDVEKIADGRVFIASKAKGLGLIDAVSSQEDVLLELNSKSSPSTRSFHTMPYNAEQLAQARQLPGVANATEENADVLVLTAAIDLRRQLTDTQANFQSAKDKLPPVYPPELLQGYADLAMGQVNLAAQQGKLLPAQVEQMKKMILPDGKPNAAMLVASTGQEPAYKNFMQVVELNKPNGLLEVKSGAQPAPITEPGGQGKTGSAPSYERWNELRMQSALPVETIDQYKARFNLK